jgi:hypothetical protein
MDNQVSQSVPLGDVAFSGNNQSVGSKIEGEKFL